MMEFDAAYLARVAQQLSHYEAKPLYTAALARCVALTVDDEIATATLLTQQAAPVGTLNIRTVQDWIAQVATAVGTPEEAAAQAQVDLLVQFTATLKLISEWVAPTPA